MISLRGRRLRFSVGSVENIVAMLVLLLIALLPTLEVFARRFFKTGIYASANYLKHLIVWITFLGGMITQREKRHLALSVGIDMIKDPVSHWIRVLTSLICVSICVALMWSSASLTLIGFDPEQRMGLLPIRVAVLIIPVGFAVMGIRFLLQTPRVPGKAIAGAGIVLGTLLALQPAFNALETGLMELSLGTDWLWSVQAALPSLFSPLSTVLAWVFCIILVVAVLLGVPIFIGLGGLAFVLFWHSGGALEVIPDEAYAMLTGPAIPAIPLFTLAGFILSESKAGERLMRLFRSFFGWLPGGLGIMSILVCAFFTTFTGGSGVTILALGALLLFVLVNSKYKEGFSRGLLTASGSVGLLFPPSLPIILYGVVAQTNIKELFLGGIGPGALIMLALSTLVIVRSWKDKTERQAFNFREAASSFRESIWEILLPVVIIVGFFSGFTTIVETGAIAVVYALLVEGVIHRDLKIKDLLSVFRKCVPIIGGVLIILAVAKGFSYYIVDAGLPMALTGWIRAHISSKYVFLILLNLALLITGCFMDIFSAITVVVPLMRPLGDLFGINEVHLGVIFLANLELGYLTPPVGLNLFLASYRFNTPLIRIYRSVFPFFLVMLVAVLIITYVPWITTFLLGVIQF